MAWPLPKGVLAGDVLDPQGAIIPGTYVVALSDSGKDDPFPHSVRTCSDDLGKYLLELRAHHNYKVCFSKRDFRTQCINAVVPDNKKVLEMNVTLRIGGGTCRMSDCPEPDDPCAKPSKTRL